MKNIQLKVFDQRIIDNRPMYATPGSAGLDLCACIHAGFDLEPGATFLIPTGFGMHIADPNIAAMILPRSGLGHKMGLILGNSVGLIDSDYQGQVMVSAWNRSDKAIRIEPMMKLAQLVFVPIIQVDFNIVDEFYELDTERGTGGFGSTGII